MHNFSSPYSKCCLGFGLVIMFAMGLFSYEVASVMKAYARVSTFDPRYVEGRDVRRAERELDALPICRRRDAVEDWRQCVISAAPRIVSYLRSLHFGDAVFPYLSRNPQDLQISNALALVVKAGRDDVLAHEGYWQASESTWRVWNDSILFRLASEFPPHLPSELSRRIVNDGLARFEAVSQDPSSYFALRRGPFPGAI